MTTLTNHYLSLKLSANGKDRQGVPYTEYDIKKAYRAAALVVHPDKNKSDAAAKEFQEIQDAYQLLMDVNSRRDFDRSLEQTGLAFQSNSHLILLDDEVRLPAFESKDEPNAVIMFERTGIDLTSLITNSQFNIETLIEEAEKNINFMHAILSGTSIWLQLPLEGQFKLFLKAYAMSLDGRKDDFQRKPFIKMLLASITSITNYQSAFVVACLNNKELAAQFLESGLIDLDQFEEKMLRDLSFEFFTPVASLLRKYLLKQKITVLFKLDIKYPNTIVEQAIRSNAVVVAKMQSFIRLMQIIVKYEKGDRTAFTTIQQEDLRAVGADILWLDFDGEKTKIDFYKACIDFIVEHTVDFDNIDKDQRNQLIKVYCSWMQNAFQTYESKATNYESLHESLRLTPNHFRLLALLPNNDYDKLLENINLILFMPQSRKLLIDHIFNREIIPNEFNLLLKLLGDNCDYWLKTLEKNNLLDELIKRPNYFLKLEEHKLHKLTYILAKNPALINQDFVKKQSVQFQQLYTAFTALLNPIKNLLQKLKADGKATLSMDTQQQILYEEFQHYVQVTGYFQDLSYYIQRDLRIQIRVCELAFSANTPRSPDEFTALKFRCLNVLLRLETSNGITLFLENFKSLDSKDVILKALALRVNDLSANAKFTILGRMFTCYHNDWAKSNITGALLDSYYEYSIDNVSFKEPIFRQASVQTKHDAYVQLKRALNVVFERVVGSFSKADEVVSIDEILGYIMKSGLDKKTLDLVQKEIKIHKFFHYAVMHSLLELFKGEISGALEAEIRSALLPLSNNVDFLLRFRTLAESYLEENYKSIASDTLIKLVDEHGLELLEDYPALRAQCKQARKLNSVLERIQNDAVFENRDVQKFEEIARVHQELETFIMANDEIVLSNPGRAIELYDSLMFIKDKYQHIKSKLYVEAFPKNEPADVFAWTMNIAFQQEQFATDKLNALIATHSNVSKIYWKLISATKDDFSKLESVLQPANELAVFMHALKGIRFSDYLKYKFTQFIAQHNNITALSHFSEIERNRFLSVYFKFRKTKFHWPQNSDEAKSSVICKLVQAELLSLEDLHTHAERLVQFLNISELADYINRYLDTNNLQIKVEPLFVLPLSHYFFYYPINTNIFTCETVLKWKANSFEFAFYKNYLFRGGLQLEQLQLSIPFFLSQDFDNLSELYLREFEQLGSTAAREVYNEILTQAYSLDFSNPEALKDFITTTENKITCYYIRHEPDHPISDLVMQKFIDSGLNTGLLINRYDNQSANTIFSRYMRRTNAVFKWPTSYESARYNTICRLVLYGAITMANAVILKQEQLDKFDIGVCFYLESRMNIFKEIDLTILFGMDDAHLVFYPLLDNKFVTTIDINKFEDLHVVIYKRFIQDAELNEWRSPSHLERLKVICPLLNSSHCETFILDFIRPIKIESLYLSLKDGDCITSPGIIKASQLRVVMHELIQIFMSELFSVSSRQASSIAPDLFFTQVNKKLIVALRENMHKGTICQHRNLIHRFLKALLDVLTFIIKPFVSENYRLRLFAPVSAKRLFEIEDTLASQLPAPQL